MQTCFSNWLTPSPDTGTGAPADCSHNLLITMKNQTRGESPLSATPCSVLLERGKEFRFNDHVCVEMLMGVPIERRSGRLVQVRKGCGQFGSNTYFMRLRDGSLATFENVMIRHVDDEQFGDAFYRLNGKDAPVIPPQAIVDSDSEAATYTICGKWPESGFIVDAPKQPETLGIFSMAISSPNDEVCHGANNQKGNDNE